MKRAEQDHRASLSHILSLVIGFGVVFSLTATWGLEANVDAIAAALPAWSLVEHGSIALDRFAEMNPWIVEGAGSFVSNRPPGLSAVAVPAYTIVQSDTFVNAQATATAVAMSVAAIVTAYVLFCRLMSQRNALLAATVMGLGTSTWSISSDALWPHGPGQLWALLGLLAVSNMQYARGGFALAAALLTRPITAVSSAVLGIAEGWRQRSWRPPVEMGIPVAAALGLLLTYNRAVFGVWSVSGGYRNVFEDRMGSMPLVDHLSNLFAMLVSPQNGLLVWSPVVLIGAMGAVAMWHTLPPWTRSAFVAALVYIVIHARLNRASGGLGFGYRYPLEALALASPALAAGAFHIAQRSRIGQRITIAAAGLSVALQFVLVLLLECKDTGGPEAVCSFF